MRRTLIATAALLLGTESLSAQILASERAMVSQTVDGTRITVDYSRPRARGRTNMYGGMERWGRAWTPGADDATTLEVSKPVQLLGLAVPKGKYSVWLVLREHGPWTFVLDPRAGLFHTAHPDSTSQQLRAPVTPRQVTHTDVLTWSFPAVSPSGATLDFRWGTMGIEVPITVTPTLPLTVTAAEAAPYLGEYEVTGRGSRFVVSLQNGRLIGRFEPRVAGVEEMQLLPSGPDRFAYGLWRNGELWSTNAQLQVRFLRTGERVSGFEYVDGSSVMARGTRR
ncbi:MAG: DUF2911 domain-containing protein [Cytophagaceae bacterium]|nr:DUF2911 domain-containing protein [Gemmatimonadaceae bacterium]